MRRQVLLQIILINECQLYREESFYDANKFTTFQSHNVSDKANFALINRKNISLDFPYSTGRNDVDDHTDSLKHKVVINQFGK